MLLVTAAGAYALDRRASLGSDAGRVVAALGAGALVAGAGLLAARVGPPRITGDTSKDAFLRRVGEFGALRDTYLYRFREGWPRYAPVMNTILVLGGATHGRGFSRRFLLSWLAFTAVAVPFGVFTGAFPPDRVLTFAFCIPLLAALGLVWLGSNSVDGGWRGRWGSSWWR